MNQTERDIICKHLPALLQEIKCNDIFLAYIENAGAITGPEKETIKLQLIAGEGSSSQVNKLLSIIPSRLNGFQILIDALNKTRQNGVVKLLTGDGQAESSKSGGFNTPKACAMVVGSPVCKISKIVRIVEKNSVGHAFLNKLSVFARELEINPGKMNQILNSDDDNGDKLESLLEQWKLEKAEAATLSALLNAVDECDAKTISDNLIEKFNCRR